MCYSTCDFNFSWKRNKWDSVQKIWESIDVARKGKFTRVVFSKMVMERKNNGRNTSSGTLL